MGWFRLGLLYLYCCLAVHVSGQPMNRLESEIKLAVADSTVQRLESYLNKHFSHIYYVNAKDSLFIQRASEVFIDKYFDTKEQNLLNLQIGLRHRQRKYENEELRELVQLKLPASDNGVLRREIKFECSGNQDIFDLSRHPLLQYLSVEDRDQLSFYLRKYGLGIEGLREEIQLQQKRTRIYFSDAQSSVATITLDKVKHKSFPFQGFTELEIEINELRYTNADQTERRYLENFVSTLESTIRDEFPILKTDQTPKYNKLFVAVRNSKLSTASQMSMWIIYVFIIVLACVKLVRT